jgi:hypothetical protein
LVKRNVGGPGPRLAERDFTLQTILRSRRHFTRQGAADRVRCGILAIIVDEHKARITQLVKIPKIARAAVLPQLDDEKIITTTFNQ